METKKDVVKIEGHILCKEFRYFYAGDIYYLIEAKLCANNKFYIMYTEKDNYITNISNGNMCKLEIILNHKEFTQLLKVED